MRLPSEAVRRPGAGDESRWMRELLEVADGGLLALDADWNITLVNHNGAAIMGRPASELLGRKLWEFFPEQGYFRPQYELARRTRTPVHFETRSPSGRWFEVRAVPQGEMLYIAFRLITDRKRREEALARSEARFRSLVGASAQLIWRMDAAGNNVGGSSSWAEYTGRALESAYGDGWLALVHPDDRERIQLGHRELIANPRFVESEYRLRRYDGAYRRFLVRIVPVHGPAGELQEFVGACVDIEDRHRTELERQELIRALDRKRERLASILEALPVGVVLAEAGTGRLLQTNRAFEQLDAEAVQRLTRAAGMSPINRAIRDGVPVEGEEIRLVLSNGDERWLRVSAVPLRDPSGAVTASLGTTLDITERKRAEEALRESETKLRFCLETMPQQVWMALPDGSIDFFNRRWLEYTGLSHAESVGFGWLSVIHADDEEACSIAWERATAGGTVFEVELRLRAASGSYGWFLVRALPMRDHQDRITRWFGTCTDIDEQKRTQETLAALEEFQHQLIGVVSHDLRSPLAAMTTTVGVLLRSSTNLTSDQRHSIERIRGTAERMRAITRDLLDYTQARVGAGLPLDPVPADVAVICASAAAEARILAPQREITVSGDGAAEVCWDARRIEQALSNVLVNAIKYGDGAIALRWHAGPDHVTLEVENEGEPIEDALLPQLFQPFRPGERREAPVMQSLGLGLYIVREIARAHRGTATIESLARGNLVRLVLPRTVEA